MRPIDADALMEAIKSLKVEKESPQMIWSGDVEAIIKDAQPALVRCGECEYFNPLHAFCLMGTNGADFYCARGKRREE